MTERWVEWMIGGLLCLDGALVVFDAATEMDWLQVLVGVCLLFTGVLRLLPKKPPQKGNNP